MVAVLVVVVFFLDFVAPIKVKKKNDVKSFNLITLFFLLPFTQYAHLYRSQVTPLVASLMKKKLSKRMITATWPITLIGR